MTTFTLAHLSDPHLAPLPRPRRRELAGKRMLGYVNWTRNRHLWHRRDILDALIADMQAQQPDHIVVTGDIVNLALNSEFAPARVWLDGIGTPDRVSVIPGNHDAYVRSTMHRFAETFQDFIAGDQPSPAPYPYLRRRGGVALIGVSSGVPTAPMLATGWLGSVQRAALEQTLEGLRGENLFRVLLIHHPLLSAARPKRLVDSRPLLALLRKHGVDLVLHGHDHVHSTAWFDGPAAKFPAIGVASASAVGHGHVPPAAYNLFAITRTESEAGHSWRCRQTIRGRMPNGSFAELSSVDLV